MDGRKRSSLRHQKASAFNNIKLNVFHIHTSHSYSHAHTHIHTHTLTHLSRVYSLKLDLYSNLKSQNRQSRGRGREMAGGRGGKREWEGGGGRHNL